MATPTFKAKITSWSTLNQNLKAQLPTLPHLQGQQQDLEQLIADAHGLEAQQTVQTAALRETNRQRFDLEKRGDDLRERLAGSLRGQFGPKDMKLLEFGVKPKAERRRTAPTPEQKRQQKVERLKQQLSELEGSAKAP